MQSSYWIALLRHIPAEEHAKLMLVTSSGTEIAVNSLLMIEGDCLGVKGRLSGSQDTGRVFFVPYDHIDYLGFTRSVTDEEFKNFFGEGGGRVRGEANQAPTRATSVPTMLVPPVQQGEIALTPEQHLSPTVLLEPTPGGRLPSTSMRTPVTNRAALLESIRARGLTPRPTPGPNSSGS